MKGIFKGHKKGLLLAVALFVLAFSSTLFADSTKNLGELKNNGALETSGLMNNQGYIWHKIYAPKDGFLEVSGWEAYKNYDGSYSYYSISFSLYDGNLKRVDGYSYGDNYVSSRNGKAIHYGVAKGTYYIRLKASDSNKYAYYLYAYYKATGSKGGAKKSKALKMKTNKVYNAVIPAGKKRSLWFKFTTNGKKKPKFIVYAKGQGQIQFKIMGARLSKSTGYLSTDGTKDGCYIYTRVYRNGTFKDVAPQKGTYYVKITNYSGSNAWLKVKMRY